MKTYFRFLVVLGFILIFSGLSSFSQVSINANGDPPDNSAMLDVKSTSKGILVPRMTLEERLGIASPAAGLLVFQIDNTSGFYYNAGTSEDPDWKLVGNNASPSQISDADNDTFITTDEAPGNPDNDVINFWVKGQNTMSLVDNRLVVSSGGDNLFIGDSCGAMNTTGAGNLFIGTRAGAKADLGFSNVFLGAFAGAKNQHNSNTFVGTFSGTNNTTGWNNTFVGYESGFSNISGRTNTFIGNLSGHSNINGQRNIYLGDSSGYYNQAGVRSVYIGAGAGKNSQTGSRNVFIGDQAGANETGSYKLYLAITDTSEPLIYGAFNEGLLKFQAYRIEISNPERNTVIGHKAGLGSSGLHNVIIGDSAGAANMTGKNNIFIGTLSGTSNTFGSDNTFLGAWSGKNNSTGVQNVFIGNASGVANTEGSQNTFVGGSSGENNTSGTYNVFIGDSTGQANTTGGSNTFLGALSGKKNTTGIYNLFLGTSTGENNTDGHRNIFIGSGAGRSNTTGYRNTFMGLSAGASNTAGFYNTYLGRGTGLSNIDGSGNVFIGDLAGRNEMGSNKLYISNSDTSNPLIYGEFDNSLLKLNGQVSINTNNASVEPSAVLDLNSTSKGLLMPRMSQGEITAIVNPANGLQVFCTTDSKVYIFVSSSNQWKELAYGEGTLTPVFPCGTSFTINHVAGTVAPVTKTVTYGTVTNIPGETSKCWITSNLGADHQATAVDDATEASAGWYWQFNRKQGYKHDGITRTPNTTWLIPIDENLDWQTSNDPCTLELGSGWRIPTSTEWINVDASGGWTTWTGPWNSDLKLHAAGYLGDDENGLILNRGSFGYYWSSAQYTTAQLYQLGSLFHLEVNKSTLDYSSKAHGYSLRCIK